MIVFTIMMWFTSLILLIVAITLLMGHTSSMHGKVYEATKDKTGYGKAFGKVLLFLAVGMVCCGVIALFGTPSIGIRNAIIVLIVFAFISGYFFVRIQRHYKLML